MTNTLPITDNIKRKIMALLNLSTGRGATEAEMQTAMAMAMRLAARHRYNIDELKEESVKVEEQEEFVKAEFRTAEGETRRPPCHRHISQIIRRYFAVEIILTESSKMRNNGAITHGSKVLMIGRESDVEFVKFVYNYLRETFNRLWRKYKRDNLLPQAERASYFEGLYLGLSNKLFDEKCAEERKIAKVKQLDDAKFAIVIRTEDDKRAIATQELTGGTRPVKNVLSNVRYGKVYDDGMAHGKQININRGLDAPKKVTV